jgi:glycosyltransferase involved in cell wall biosynthesis
MKSASPAKLRILHVVDSLEMGGLERVVCDLVMAQRDAGHDVAVFSINSTQGFAPELTAAGITVIQGHKRGTLDRQVIRSMVRTMNAMKVDIVHAHNFVPNYYAALACLWGPRGSRLVTTCHDMGTRLSHRRLRMLFQLSLLKSSRVAMVGQQVHDRFVSSGMVPAHKAQTVLNGIPVQRFRATPERRAQARQKLALQPDDVVIGCVGRLVGLKNHQLLIALLPELVTRHPTLKLVIVGYGELHERLQQQAAALGMQDHLKITGQRSDVSDLLPGFDVFVLPSLTEGISIALLEASATSLPIVATAVGGNPDIIQHGHNGLLVPPDDLAATRDALEQMLAQAPQAQAMGEAAHAWVLAHASSESLRKAYDAFYAQALAA